MKFIDKIVAFAIGTSLAFLIVWSLMHAYFPKNEVSGLFTQDEPGKPRFILKQNGRSYEFDLADADDAPPAIIDDVQSGCQIFTLTKKYAPLYAGDSISCNNCHFCGGNTLGGVNGGISLVGVTKTYPRYSERNGTTITLEQRINNCFMRSLNGKSLPAGAPEMAALIAYLNWISEEVKPIPQIPWLGLKKIEIKNPPNVNNGQKLFADHCAACHGEHGQGTEQAPPLWGPQSFNDGAGMNVLDTLASFVLINMPHNNPILTEAEAIDVAGFIISRPRPKFIPR